MAYLALRGRLSGLVSDTRGIALQTVVIIVVLLAIAGGVGAVLVTQGGEAVDDLESADIGPNPDQYNNKSLCEAAGHSWSNAVACVATV